MEDVARLPAPGTSAPASIAFSPDGAVVTYLLAGVEDLDRRLFALDLATGETRLLIEPPAAVTEESMTPEERLRRERAREMGLGVTSYAWAKKANVVMTPRPDGVHVDGAPRIDGPVLDPQLSPDGSRVAYVRDGELWVDDTQLTTGADPDAGLTNGLAEFIAQEEMDRYHGFWWSPDGARIAFTEVDERHIPLFRIPHFGSDAVEDEAHRYPFVGADNAKVRLGIVDVATRAVQWLDLPDFEYLGRVDWAPDGSLLVQTTDRRQQHLTLTRFEPDGGSSTVLEEHSDVWINLHDMLRPLADGRFVWASERTGFRHLYLYERDGTLVRPLTAGDWQVDSVDGVDDEVGMVWFSATKDGPTERHLYEVSFDGGPEGIRRLTDTAGTHHATVSPALGLFVDLHSSVTAQPTANVRRLVDGAVVHPLFARPDPRVERVGMTPPELGRFGDLHYAVYRPDGAGAGPWPTALFVYGGPHAQMVSNSWARPDMMRAQYLRSRGFLVAVCDNRGSARRGLAFEGAIKHRLGHVEVEDQVAFVDHLIAQGLADPARVAVYGWSYGGYMALMLLATGRFAAAVAGAPVTGWDGYDTHYTERYLGLVDENKDGYDASAVFPYVDGIPGRGELMVVHGLIDENVHFRHTGRLANRLIAARKDYELLLFPEERHGPRRLGDRVYLEQRLTGHLEARLSVGQSA